MAYIYDTENVFAKILRKEIPNDTVMETEHSLAFHDINPNAPHHILVIPKGPYVNFDHFGAEASDAELADFSRTLAKIAEQLGVDPAHGEGYRLVTNAGKDAIQDVFHMHVHLLAGRPLGRMLSAG